MSHSNQVVAARGTNSTTELGSEHRLRTRVIDPRARVLQGMGHPTFYNASFFKIEDTTQESPAQDPPLSTCSPPDYIQPSTASTCLFPTGLLVTRARES